MTLFTTALSPYTFSKPNIGKPEVASIPQARHRPHGPSPIYPQGSPLSTHWWRGWIQPRQHRAQLGPVRKVPKGKPQIHQQPYLINQKVQILKTTYHTTSCFERNDFSVPWVLSLMTTGLEQWLPLFPMLPPQMLSVDISGSFSAPLCRRTDLHHSENSELWPAPPLRQHFKFRDLTEV